MNKHLAISNILNWAIQSQYNWPHCTCLNMIDRFLMLHNDETIQSDIKHWSKYKSEKEVLIQIRKDYASLNQAYESILDKISSIRKIENKDYIVGDIIILSCKVQLEETGEIVSVEAPYRSTLGLAITDDKVLMATANSGFVVCNPIGNNTTYTKK